MTARRICVSGATGLIGRALCAALIARGDDVIVLTREPAAAARRVPGAREYLAWQPADDGPWAEAVATSDAVVHLAGASIAGQRWSAAYQREIRDSRVIGTRGIAAAVARGQRASVLVSASGVDYYGDCGDRIIDEHSPAGRGFLPDVCVAWEAEAVRARTTDTRVCVIRTGIVLDRHEGALARLLLPYQLGLGGPVLPGTQWWSWIHRDDVVGILLLALDDARADGPLNATAPHPVRNREFSDTLARVLRRPALLPLPGFAARLVLGAMARPLLIEKQRALPHAAEALGYTFRHPTLEPALRAALATAP